MQNVTAIEGFAYGVIGADLHVLGDGTPLYLLENYLRPIPVDPQRLRELPSRMLSARTAVVGFIGRERERGELREWSQAGPRLAARWLHAPGGQGKTRLAARLAEELIDAGWKVVTATHGPGAVLPPPGSHDMRLDGAAGLLLIIDYADRWPLTHLTWLFSNALLHQTAVFTRVLLLARTAYAWPALRQKLGDYQAGVSQQLLTPLPDEPGQREQAFIAARDSFAAHYGIADPSLVVPPIGLERPEWGLILAVHMAALAGVDAHVQGRPLPQDPVGLTAYLLDRERAHWANLYENRTQPDKRALGLEFQTPPSVMSRAVFTAALTGPVNHPDGKTILGSLNLELPSERVLTDHTACYPPADPRLATVLEPLYPDRLAEDFLGVTMPGHTTDQPAYAWAPSTATTLLSRGVERTLPAYVLRAITFLVNAAERWPHVGETLLYPRLRDDPQLAVDAGTAALTALASLPHIPLDVLEAIERVLPQKRHVDLDPGIAAVIRRLTEHRLATANEPEERARLYSNLWWRLSNAGDHRQALPAAQEVVEIYQGLVAADPQSFESGLASALNNLSGCLSALGRYEEALLTIEEAVKIRRRLAALDDPVDLMLLPSNLDNFGMQLSKLGRYEEALVVTQSAVRIYRDFAAVDPGTFEPELATALDNLGLLLSRLARRKEAVLAAQEAVDIERRLATANPQIFRPDLARSLSNLSIHLGGLGRYKEAMQAAQDSVDIRSRLAAANPQAFEPDLAKSVGNLAIALRGPGRDEDGLQAAEQAVEVFRRLAVANPAAFEHDLATALNTLGSYLSSLGRHQEAVQAAEETVQIYRRLATTNPNTFESYLAQALHNLQQHVTRLSRSREVPHVAPATLGVLSISSASTPEQQVAAALFDKGLALGRRGEHEQAIAVCDEVDRRFSHITEPAVQEIVARALLYKGLFIGLLGEPDQEIAAYDEVDRRFGQFTEPAFQQVVVNGLVCKATTLDQLGEPEQEVAVYDEMDRRFGEATDPAIQEQVAKALFNKGVTLGGMGLSAQMISTYNQIIERFGGKPEPSLQEQVARALLNMGVSYSQQGNLAQALEAYEELESRFGQAAERFVQELVARALFNRGCSLGRLGELEQAIDVYNELDRRFGQATELPIQEDVARALFNKGVALEQLGKIGQAIAVYEAVEGRFRISTESAIREIAALAWDNGAKMRGKRSDP